MSVLVVGMSHHSAPVALLERVALEPDGALKLLHDAMACEHLTEAAVVSTCNRLEIYAEVDRFHGSVEELSELLVRRADRSAEALLPHLYVHYDERAVSHLFHVAAGLDSMAVGEGQILGQTRAALALGQEVGSVGPVLNVLFQQALRVGKRARAETRIDRVAPTLVGAALDRVVPAGGDLSGTRVTVVGAGAMAGLAVATVVRRGATAVTVVNRTPARGTRLAQEYAVRAAGLADLPRVLAETDLVIACAGAAELLVDVPMVRAALGPGRSLAVLDLALPHDVDPAVGDLPGVTRIDLSMLAGDLDATAPDSEVGRLVAEVRAIVTQEVAAFLAARRRASVTPTVVALRSMATAVVDAEMARLDSRLPALDPAARAEVLRTVRRVADKLLHEPTVRIKELADEVGAVSYADALAELFALDRDTVAAVSRPEGLA